MTQRDYLKELINILSLSKELEEVDNKKKETIKEINQSGSISLEQFKKIQDLYAEKTKILMNMIKTLQQELLWLQKVLIKLKILQN